MRITAIVILFIISLNALAAGFSFMVDPTGSAVGISTEYLKSSAPFEDFFIPGIVLFCAIGVGSFATALYAWMKHPRFPAMIVVQGCLLVGWIIIQLTMVEIVHLLHYLVGGAGVALIVLGVLIRCGRNVPRSKSIALSGKKFFLLL